jgi:hypothetical protein
MKFCEIQLQNFGGIPQNNMKILRNMKVIFAATFCIHPTGNPKFQA